jgi:hypothetical protein
MSSRSEYGVGRQLLGSRCMVLGRSCILQRGTFVSRLSHSSPGYQDVIAYACDDCNMQQEYKGQCHCFLNRGFARGLSNQLGLT